MKNLSHVSLLILLSGCVHMTSLSTTSIPVDRGHTVEAEGYRFMFLLINFDNKYAHQSTTDLAKQCPDGRVEGILTKKEDIMYFPLLAHAVRVSASGFCVKPAHPQASLAPVPSEADPAGAEK